MVDSICQALNTYLTFSSVFDETVQSAFILVQAKRADAYAAALNKSFHFVQRPIQFFRSRQYEPTTLNQRNLTAIRMDHTD